MSLFFYLFLAVVLVFSLFLIWPAYRKYVKEDTRLNELKEEYARKNAECVELSSVVNDLGDKPEAVEKVAREKFGLCKEGETILKYKK